MIAIVVPSACSLAAAIVSALILRKVGQVHVMINSRLTEALGAKDSQIADLQQQRDLGRRLPPGDQRAADSDDQ